MGVDRYEAGQITYLGMILVSVTHKDRILYEVAGWIPDTSSSRRLLGRAQRFFPLLVEAVNELGGIPFENLGLADIEEYDKVFISVCEVVRNDAARTVLKIGLAFGGHEKEASQPAWKTASEKEQVFLLEQAK